MDPANRASDPRPARVLGAARLLEYGASLAKRSLLVALALAPAAGAARQNVLEYVHERLVRDRSLDAPARRAIEAALEERFANYGFNVVDPQKPEDAQTLLHVISEGVLDRADPARIAAELRDGDLVFFDTSGNGVSHVGMMVDAGRRTFIHASSSHGVVEASLDDKYFQSRFLGARRVSR